MTAIKISLHYVFIFLLHSTEELEAAKEYIAYLEQQMLSQCAPTMATESPRVNHKLPISADVCAAAVADTLPPPDQCRLHQLTEELREAELQVRLFLLICPGSCCGSDFPVLYSCWQHWHNGMKPAQLWRLRNPKMLSSRRWYCNPRRKQMQPYLNRISRG